MEIQMIIHMFLITTSKLKLHVNVQYYYVKWEEFPFKSVI
jgi:hypothetical protein